MVFCRGCPMAFRLRRIFRYGFYGALLALVGIAAAISTGWTAMGTRADGARLERMRHSPRWQEGRFIDVLPRKEPGFWPALRGWLFEGSEYRAPARPQPLKSRHGNEFPSSIADGLRVTWLGHSTLLVEIDGARVLVDPVWGPRAAPFSWAGPKRFHRPPLPFRELPKLDAVLISHDHYDHLDHPTIVRLARKDVDFVVPLGVGAHLQYWGVPETRITELDWWEEHEVAGVRLVATPSRHFSGRSLTDRDCTLWSGWALIGPAHRAYYSGDTAMFPGFTEIGERLGPFHVTMIESGAYNAMWADVHLGPEQAVQAHRMVQGKIMIPVHWGTFDLALHGWTEPMERVLVAANQEGVHVATPRIGETVDALNPPQVARWWPKVPWKTAKQDPVTSSGLEQTVRIGTLWGTREAPHVGHMK